MPRVPGAWRLMVHHVRWRSAGGATSAENCATLCGRCHALVHEGLLVNSREAPHRLRFLRAGGTLLGERGEALRPIVRRIGVESGVPGGEAKASRVTFKDLGAVMDAGRVEPAEGPAEVGLEGIVGQEEAKRLFARAAAAAGREGWTVPHCLIDGPAGTGKSAVALVTLFLSAARGSIIFIDEIDALPEAARLLHVRTGREMERDAATA